MKAAETTNRPTLAFSCGYYGWGPYTDKLVELVDTVEAARGVEPPVFADVRSLQPTDRRRFDRGGGACDPAAANTLLDLIIDCASSSRRVIAFIEALVLFGMSDDAFARKYPG